MTESDKSIQAYGIAFAGERIEIKADATRTNETVPADITMTVSGPDPTNYNHVEFDPEPANRYYADTVPSDRKLPKNPFDIDLLIKTGAIEKRPVVVQIQITDNKLEFQGFVKNGTDAKFESVTAANTDSYANFLYREAGSKSVKLIIANTQGEKFPEKHQFNLGLVVKNENGSELPIFIDPKVHNTGNP